MIRLLWRWTALPRWLGGGFLAGTVAVWIERLAWAAEASPDEAWRLVRAFIGVAFLFALLVLAVSRRPQHSKGPKRPSRWHRGKEAAERWERISRPHHPDAAHRRPPRARQAVPRGGRVTTIPLATRRWRIRATGARPLTLNKVREMHYQQWAAHVRATRHLWWGLALEARVPRLDRITVTVTPLHRNGRSPQDVAACAAEAKAAIDGLVDARVIPDDNSNHLLLVSFTPADICGVDGMALLIEEAL